MLKNKFSGFTIIEMAVVLVIIGILMGTIYKGSSSSIKSAQIHDAVSLIGDLSAGVKEFKARYHYLPGDMPEAYEYSFIFHTHPPEKGGPGSRAPYGILYEFPSSSDLLHFIEHYNNGITIGSLVMTPEGLYNIRKHKLDSKKFLKLL